MKKPLIIKNIPYGAGLLIIIGIVFIIVSCGDFDKQEPGRIIIKNNSTKDVSYKLGTLPEVTVKKGSQATFILPIYTYMRSYEPSKRTSLITDYPNKNDILYIFSDRKNYPVEVENKTTIPLIIVADGWMDDNMELDGSPVQSEPDWLIYTDKPDFKVTNLAGEPAKDVDDSPAEVEYKLVAGVLKVIVRWWGK